MQHFFQDCVPCPKITNIDYSKQFEDNEIKRKATLLLYASIRLSCIGIITIDN